MKELKLGQRVYYKDRGVRDSGTIIDVIIDDDFPYVVKWDGDNIHDEECIDQFQAHQLGVLTQDE